MYSPEKEIKRGAILSSINTIFTIISTFMISPFILDALGSSQYGLYSFVGALVSGITLLNFGLNGSMVRFIAKYRMMGDKESEEKFYGMSFLLFAGISVLALFVGLLMMKYVGSFNSVGSEYELPARVMLACMCGNMVFTTATQVFPSVLTAYERFTFLRGWELLRNVINPIIKIIIIFTMGIDALIIIIIDIVFNILYQIIVIAYAKKKLKIHFRFRGIEFAMLKEVFSYSFFIFIGVLVDMLYWRTDIYILGVVSTSQEVAVLNLGNHFSDYFIRIATMLCGMLMTKVVGMVMNNATPKILTDAMIKLGRIQFLILGLILTGYIICGRHFVDQWARGDYDHSSIYYIGLMLLIPLIIPEIEILGISILQAKNMHKFRSISYLCIAVLNVAMSIPLAQRYGAIGATVGTVISLVIGQIIVMNIYYKRAVGLEIGRFFKEVFKGILPAMLGTLFLGCGTFLLPQSGLPSLFLRMSIIILVYCVLQWGVGMNGYEKNLILSPIKKVRRKIHAKISG